ncbi:MAG: hypothetical protein ACD_75C00795G0005, partial [uncultured bacterium]
MHLGNFRQNIDDMKRFTSTRRYAHRFCRVLGAFFLAMMVFPAFCLSASVTITSEVQGDGAVILTARGTFEICKTCDANGNNCTNTDSGSVGITHYCSASGHGSATCTAILDRGGLHGTHSFVANANDCKGSASDSTVLTLDNTPSVAITSPGGTVSGSFDVAGDVTFKSTTSPTKGTIAAYIN